MRGHTHAPIDLITSKMTSFGIPFNHDQDTLTWHCFFGKRTGHDHMRLKRLRTHHPQKRIQRAHLRLLQGQGEIIEEGKIDNAGTRTTRTTGYGTVISYGKTQSADILKWIEKNPAFPSDSPLTERTLANTAAIPSSENRDGHNYKVKYRKCYATQRGQQLLS